MTLLSICVPTYNRSYLLEGTIESIVASVSFSGYSNVEIIISDNASTDDTQLMIRKLTNRYPFIRSRLNDKNVQDENFFIAAREAKGEYVWIFGDDDLMEIHAVAEVLKSIKANHQLILLNYSIWNKDFSELVRPVRYNYKENLTFEKSNDVLKYFGTGPQFISSVVIEKKLFLSEKSYDYRRLHPYGNSFLYAVYAAISESKGRTSYLSAPLLKYRGYNSNISCPDVWYKYFIYGNNKFLGLLKHYKYSLAARRSTRKEIIVYYLFRDIAARKKNGYNTLKLLNKIPLIYYGHLSFVAVGLPILLIPNRIFNLFYRLIKLRK
jgi:glycosyltransferase involved in cell wall biosynthesis